MNEIVAGICITGNAFLNAFKYAEGLAMTKGRKTCTEIARSTDTKHDSVLRQLNGAVKERPQVREELRERVQRRIKETGCSGALIIDSTLVIKQHSRKIAGVSRQYAGSQRSAKTAPGISVTATSWTDLQGGMLEPVDLFIWQKGEKPKEQTAITHGIMLAQLLGISTMLLDASFATKGAFTELQPTSIFVVMRFHCNRSVYVEGFGKSQLRHHPAFQFERNQRAIVRTVVWHNLTLQVIALKVFNAKKNDWFTLFLVTNAPLEKAREYAAFYKHRWKTEPFFRTSKQTYGLEHCQARRIEQQEAHFLSVLLAYSNSVRNKPAPAEEKSKPRAFIPMLRNKSRMKPSASSMRRSLSDYA